MLSWRVRLTGSRHHRPEARHAAAAALLLIWLVTGIWLTFAFDYQITNVWGSLGLYGRQLHPFVGLYHLHSYDPARVDRVNRAIDVYGNRLLFAPLAVILPLAWSRTRWWHVMVLVGVLSSGVEIVQHFVGGRVSQLSDVIANTTGAMVFFAAFAAGRWTVRRVGARVADRRRVAATAEAVPIRS